MLLAIAKVAGSNLRVRREGAGSEGDEGARKEMMCRQGIGVSIECFRNMQSEVMLVVVLGRDVWVCECDDDGEKEGIATAEINKDPSPSRLPVCRLSCYFGARRNPHVGAALAPAPRKVYLGI